MLLYVLLWAYETHAKDRFERSEQHVSKKWLQEEQDEHGQGKWEGEQKGKSGKRITHVGKAAFSIFSSKFREGNSVNYARYTTD
jgi:hypothetical protein